jgi:4-hydroxy-2-oxoheptanedioate aldolase
MADKLRLNKAIELLEQGKTVFSTGTVPSGNIDDITFVADSDFDMIILETEHEAFGFEQLRVSLQYLLSRKNIAEKGNLQPDVVPFVRIPPNSREAASNQWVIKQTLDAGAFGIVLPHLNTVEEAKAAVVASRYPQVPGVADFYPEGERGWSNRLAVRFWGISTTEYHDVADLWPLDPDGEVLIMAIVEEAQGVKNVRDILREVKGIGAVWAGPGDLSVSMGKRGNARDPEVQEALLRVLEACKEFDVPCASGATAADVEQRIEQGFRIIIAPPTKVDDALRIGRKAAGR